jgi:hypothetical protein
MREAASLCCRRRPEPQSKMHECTYSMNFFITEPEPRCFPFPELHQDDATLRTDSTMYGTVLSDTHESGLVLSISTGLESMQIMFLLSSKETSFSCMEGTRSNYCTYLIFCIYHISISKRDVL